MMTGLWALGLAALSPASVGSESQGVEKVEFVVSGGAWIDKGLPNEDIILVDFVSAPNAELIRGVDWSRVSHEATVSAHCITQVGGALGDCVIDRAVPEDPEQFAVYRHALKQLRLKSPDLGRVRLGSTVFVQLYLKNPGGTARDQNFCRDPFCTATPPPPEPRPERRGERG